MIFKHNRTINLHFSFAFTFLHHKSSQKILFVYAKSTDLIDSMRQIKRMGVICICMDQKCLVVKVRGKMSWLLLGIMFTIQTFFRDLDSRFLESIK